MNEQFQITITINYDNKSLTLDTESKMIDTENPSIYFVTVSKYLHQQILSSLESKLALSDQIADLIKLCVDNGINDSEED
ncbi:hypothetical protein [Providencia sp. PROV273]|uniref:hypothetical protein n=1 Tax=Providencia sp. PROV273 TaxID=2949960 RepID=UPI00234B5286|nr:hypothetical protein [Providencia sp. PROV273]